MLKKPLLFCFFVLACLSYASMREENLLHRESRKKILLMSLPKSGTHLLRKAVLLITDQPTRWIGLQTRQFDPEADLRDSHLITGAHLFPFFDHIRTDYLERYRVVLLIRDPRDIMLSFTSHLRRALFWTSCLQFDYDSFYKLSASEQIREALLFPKECLNPAICFPYVHLWRQEPSVLTLRFEDLVGSRGGGCDQRQFTALSSLAHHIGYPKTDEELHAIAGKLFGGTWTFDVGKIGRWKENYSENNLELFTRLYGPYLAEWGYFP